MINRTLIRLKVVQLLYASLISREDINEVSRLQARKSLDKALAKAYELYASLLELPVELTRLRDRQLDEGRHKYLPTADDLNPKTNFIDNKFVELVRNSREMEAYKKENPFDWDTDQTFLRKLLDEIMSSDIYREYMTLEKPSFKEDCEFWRKMFKDVIFTSDTLAENLENNSVYWNDDLRIMGTFVIKTIKSISNEKSHPELRLLPVYKDEEDKEFGPALFMNALENREKYRGYIDGFVKKTWDPERLAFMDVIIMIAAIAELIKFPQIPLPVTMNEYTEIAADYSGSKSSQFVNGLLFSVAEKLKQEKIILK